jgi:hypothetical protein
MAFIRTRINRKTGAVYRYWQASKRVGSKVVSVHLGPADNEPSVPAMLYDAYMDAFNAQAAKEKASEEAVPSATPDAEAAPHSMASTEAATEGGRS